MDFLNALATVLTIETGFISNIQDLNSWKDKQKLKNLNADVSYEEVAADVIKYAEAADEYIAKQHQNMTGAKVVTDEDRLRFVEAFYSSHSDCRIYREYVDPYLNSYLDKVDKLLSGMMGGGEKFINKRVSDILTIVKATAQEIKYVGDTTGHILPLAEISAKNSIALREDVQGLRKDIVDIREKLTDTQKTLDDVLVLIDRNYIDGHKADISQYERCRFEYYNVGTSADSIFKAVINGLSVTTDEYKEIRKSIYETAAASRALFLMADGGMGKSTLLCQVAVRAVEDGYKVYFADGKVDVKAVNWDGIKEETFFLLDNVSNNPKLVAMLYVLSEKNRYIHVILTDRIHKINSLISELDMPGWIIEGKAIILSNDEKSSFYIPFHKKNVKKIILSEGLRKAMSDEAIASTVAYEELNEEIAEKVRRYLPYTNRSVTDIVLDFCVKYNADAGADVKPIREFRWDWDIWDEIPELAGNFRYLAALNCYGVSVSVRQMEKIVGHPLDIGKMVDEGRLLVIRLKDQEIIKLRHDTIADNFFKIKQLRASDVIEELFEGRKFNEKTVVQFEREAFSLSNIFQANEEVKQLRIPELIGEFNRIDEYRRILGEHQRIHSLEFATIAVKASGAKEKEKYYRKQIGISYKAVSPFYSNRLLLWIKYFFFAVDHADTIPTELLIPLQTVPGLYKKVTKTIDDYLRRAYRSFDYEKREKWLAKTEKLFNWIIENINRDDVPSRIVLLWVYQHSGKAEKAKDMVSELSGLEESAMGKSELSAAYIRTYEGEVRQLLKQDRNDPRIRETNHFIWRYYKNLLDNTDKNTDEYITVVRGYVRFQKDTRHFDDAYQTAWDTVEYLETNYPEIILSRLYIELGMICQYRNKRNKNYNMNEAISWFQKAIEVIEPSSRELLYALKPLCKSYLFTNQTEECIRICDRIKAIDFRDREVIPIRYEAIRLQRVKEMQLPIGDAYKWEEKPGPEELAYEFNKLMNEMTEEQLAFAELFGLKENFQKTKFDVYCAAFSIRNNIYIPRSILSRLRISNTLAVDRLIGSQHRPL